MRHIIATVEDITAVSTIIGSFFFGFIAFTASFIDIGLPIKISHKYAIINSIGININELFITSTLNPPASYDEQ